MQKMTLAEHQSLARHSFFEVLKRRGLHGELNEDEGRNRALAFQDAASVTSRESAAAHLSGLARKELQNNWDDAAHQEPIR